MSALNPILDDVFVAFQVIPRLKEGNNFEVVDKLNCMANNPILLDSKMRYIVPL